MQHRFCSHSTSFLAICGKLMCWNGFICEIYVCELMLSVPFSTLLFKFSLGMVNRILHFSWKFTADI